MKMIMELAIFFELVVVHEVVLVGRMLAIDQSTFVI